MIKTVNLHNGAKSLPSFYQGIRFRSRAEARWAGFFTAAGIRFEYEPEAIELASGLRYLPDFWLPGVWSRSNGPGIWCEVKGHLTHVDEVKVEGLCLATQRTVALVGAEVDNQCGVETNYEYSFVRRYEDGSSGWDNFMSFMGCDDCGTVKYEFCEGNYMNCPKCGSVSSYMSESLESARAYARSMRFNRSGICIS